MTGETVCCHIRPITKKGTPMKKILVTIPVNDRQKAQLERALAGGFDCELVYASPEEATDEQLAEAHAIMGVIFAEQLKKAKNLEWLQSNRSGVDEFTKPGVLPEGAILTSATGAYGLAVGEHMLALTFALVRRLPEYARR